MRSLIQAYVQCGGNPDDLKALFKPEPLALPEGEAAFFKQYEDEMGDMNV